MEQNHSVPKKELRNNFNSFTNLSDTCRESLGQKNERAWDSADNKQKLEMLKHLILLPQSYNFLTLEFKQLLSLHTQEERHAKDKILGRHPSTEEYWYNFPERQLQWLNEIQKKDG